MNAILSSVSPTPPSPRSCALSSDSDTKIISEVLNGLGLTASESSVSISLLKTGARQASAIAKQTGMSRPHIYEVLDRLLHRGLVSVHERDGVRCFSSVTLDELMLQLEQQESGLAEQRRQLGEIIKNSRISRPDLFADPRTKSFRGAEAQAKLLQDLTRQDSEWLLLLCSARQSLLFSDMEPTKDSLAHLMSLVPARLRVVLHSSSKETDRMVQDLKNPQITTLQQELSSEMIVSRSRVTLLGKKGFSPVTITIEQPALAQSILLFTKNSEAGIEQLLQDNFLESSEDKSS